MKKIKNKKIFWAGVIALVVVIPIITVSVNADGPFKPIDPNIPVNRRNGGPVINFEAWVYNVLWEKKWQRDNITGGEAARIATDGSNFYVVGKDYNNDCVILKYSPTGDLLWNVAPSGLSQPEDLAEYVQYHPQNGKGQGQQWNFTPEQQDLSFRILNMSNLYDICYDSSRQEVIAVGQAKVLGIPVLFIVKHDAITGQKIWDKVYSFLGTGFTGNPLGGGVSVSADGEIFISGGVYTSMIIDFMGNPAEIITSIIGLNLNLGSNGVRHWVTIDDRLSDNDWVVYSGNGFASGRLFTAGYKLNGTIFEVNYAFETSELDVNTGHVINSVERFNNMFVVHMIVDESDNNTIYAVGGQALEQSGMLLRLTSDLNLTYEKIVTGDFFQDIAIKGNILALCGIVTGEKYTISLFDKNGERLVRFGVGHPSSNGNSHPYAGSGIVVDSNSDIAISGGVGAIDTLKCNVSYVTSMESIRMEMGP